ncbi:hypothetical protein F3Y22_tig00111402pilonHSYRG00781 [Hibiscus syriacus]|uniref:Uncharacterized protein n=1 Tax=Hibiscus syriacus TaxID=106335 RepID=A0A6A2YKN4_HIBSY|nr:hypothetical protein F3Y22_tig00111402pilonHSYRG00781 [Hibiscus syriacus]
MISLCPTFGGSNPGLQAEVIHAVKEDINMICGCSLAAHPSAFASISILPFSHLFRYYLSHLVAPAASLKPGRSKWNGNVGNSGIVVRVDVPLSSMGCPSFSVQINNVLEF